MKLLVSVRSAVEALAAFEGGADLIDVKEPLRGPLGKADDRVIAEIAAFIDGRRMVSAAMGELKDAAEEVLPSCPLDYIKFGLAGCVGLPWRERLIDLCSRDAESSERSAPRSIVVPCAYADVERAEAPPVEDVAAFAIANAFPVMLIDTFRKDGRDLFQWMTEERISKLVEQLRNAGVAVALAGSLKEQHLSTVRRIDPAWIAVRGAVCVGGKRESRIDMKSVKSLKSILEMN